MSLSTDFQILKKDYHKPDGQMLLPLRNASNSDDSPAGMTHRIIEQARAEALEIKETARREGHEQGYREGQQAGEKLRTEAQSIRKQAKKVLAQAEEMRSQTLDEMEPEILQLSVEIAERLVESQLTVAPETIKSIVRTAVEAARDRERVVIHVSPGEAELVRNHSNEFLSALGPGATIRVISDAEIAAGGCRIETEGVLLDATLETRWKLLLEGLRKDAR